MSVYITRTAKFLPNDPIRNDEMEEVLGKINERESKAKELTLSRNGIKTRYYSLNKKGELIYTNAELAKNAIMQLFNEEYPLNSTQLLACGTSCPDQLLPSHAAMVHASLPNFQPVDIISPSGVCCSGMHALKHAYLAIKANEITQAVSCGSEIASLTMQASMFDRHVEHLAELNENPILSFEKDFLRFMLSDGAGAFLLSSKPTTNNVCYKIEWIENISFANELPTCMSAGSALNDEQQLVSWKLFKPTEWAEKSMFALKQDVRVLQNVVPYGVKATKMALDKHHLDPKSINYFLVHLSSMYFKEVFYKELVSAGIDIPLEKWYTNLTEVGNIGSAAIYAILDDLPKNRPIKAGDRIILWVPESGRFSYSVICLSVT